jgi:hypothetical protein
MKAQRSNSSGGSGVPWAKGLRRIDLPWRAPEGDSDGEALFAWKARGCVRMRMCLY